MKIIDLNYLEETPLSTQLSHLTGDGWHAGAWTDINGNEASAAPHSIIKNVKSGQLFKLPKKKSKITDYFYMEWEKKMQLLNTRGLIQIDEDTFENLLCAVPPARGGWSAFLAGEAMTHGKDGKPIFTCCFEIEDRYFLTYSNIPEFEKKEYLNIYEKYLENYDLF